ncbi:hypothetical protein GS445_06520 [Rhodococcus hoagii]|uniref:Uncharacterized protein n=1 Tax=Rhodococcus hoagii TaxID=43767 RepID=A0A9Q2S5T1_RHOHA|nr:hypothetical protein [Prescottella equi]MBM4487423.1 hypothetical protein [Prescottella equi]MBM4497611.1 hypothetical protein [Prescottella equi]MBM4498261.1 hypothetical protein [Prescottella equi]MBM4509071.1 hypothetical protein [Prescottella equi]MBM4549344.1 hypothetical protein [Prescottella equi]
MSTAEQIIAEVLVTHGGTWVEDIAAHVVAALTNAGKTIVELPEADGAVRRTWPSLGAVPHDVKVEDGDGDEFEYYPCDNGWRYTLPDGGLSGLFDGSDELGTLTEVVVPTLGEWAAARVAEGGERHG